MEIRLKVSNFIALKVALSFKKLLVFRLTYPKDFIFVSLLEIGYKDGAGPVVSYKRI